MGSGASSSSKVVSPVQTIAKTDEKSDQRPTSGQTQKSQIRLKRTNSSKIQPDDTKVTSIQSSKEKQHNISHKAENDAAEEITKLKLQVQNLEKQLGETESSKLDLEDQIQALQERLDQEHQQAVASEEQDCTETVKVKDHHIEKLEKEAEASQDELAKLKARYKKKLRMANKKLLEAKQESSVKSFELRDEIVRLTEENTKLTERLKDAESGTRKGKPRDDFDLLASRVSKSDAFDDSRTKIILELSAKVSEQDEQISDLNSQLKQKDKTIEELQEKLVLNQARVDGQPRSNSSREGGRRPVPPDVWTNRPSSESDSSRRTPCDGRSKDKPHKKKIFITAESDTEEQGCEKSEKRAVDTKNDQDEDSGLRELKRIAAQVKRLHQKKNKKRMKQLSNGDCRESSSTSRDSGVDTIVSDSKYERELSGASLTTVSEKDSVTADRSNKPPSGRNSSKSSAKSYTSAASELSWDDSSDDGELEKETSKTRNDSVHVQRNSSHKKKVKRADVPVDDGDDDDIDDLLNDVDINTSDRKPPSGLNSLRKGSTKYSEQDTYPRTPSADKKWT